MKIFYLSTVTVQHVEVSGRQEAIHEAIGTALAQQMRTLKIMMSPGQCEYFSLLSPENSVLYYALH